MLTKKCFYFWLILVFLSCTKKETVPAKSSAKSLISFSFNTLSPAIQASIDSVQRTITATLPAATNLSNLVPIITISSKATVSPASGVAQDFTKPVIYTVTAEDGSTQKYEATIKTAALDANGGTLYIASDDKLSAVDIQTGTQKWEFEMFGAIQYTASPTVNNGVVYVGDINGSFYAIDAKTGIKKWVFQTVDYAKIHSTATVYNKIVYFGSGNSLYALNTDTGKIKWSFLTGYNIDASPTVKDGVVYIVSTDGYLYACNANTGGLNWKFKSISGSSSSPLINNESVYNANIQYLCALNKASGLKKWDFDMIGSGTYSSPTIYNGIVFIGVALTRGDKLSAVDSQTGIKKWETTVGGSSGMFSSPFVTNDIAYIGSSDQNLYALDAATGIIKWKFLTGGYIFSSPLVFNNIVYVSAEDGKLYAIDALTGSKKWELKVGSYSTSSPCIVDSQGNLYSSSISGDKQ